MRGERDRRSDGTSDGRHPDGAALGRRPPEVPGVRLDAPIGFGANGPVWGGTDTEGRPCVVTVLPVAAGERGAAQRRRLAALVGATHPNVVEVRGVVDLPRACAVVSARVDGPTLATVRAARGGLDLAEAAWLAASLGSALDHLHSRGVVHGDVSPANVVLTASGAPVLVDLAGEVAFEAGTTGFVAPERSAGAPAGRAGDAWALAATLRWVVGPADRRYAEKALAPALTNDPERRCGAREIGALLAALAAPQPVHLPDGPSLARGSLRAGALVEPTRRAPRRFGRRRDPLRRELPASGHAPALPGGARIGRATLAVLAGGAVLAGFFGAAGLAGGGLAGGGLAGGGFAGGGFAGGALDPGTPAYASGRVAEARGPTPEAASRDPAPSDGIQTGVRRLVALRDASLVSLNAGALSALAVPGSPAATADAALVETLHREGWRLLGLSTDVEKTTVLSTDGGEAHVAVVSTQAAHLRARSGAASLVHVPAQPRRCAVLVLETVGDRWLVRETAACPTEVS